MGQKLSCCGKQGTDEDGKSRKAKPLLKKKIKYSKLEAGDGIVIEKVTSVQSQPVAESAPDSDPTLSRHRLVLLEPAPSDLKLPRVEPPLVDGSINPVPDKKKLASPYADNRVSAEKTDPSPQRIDQFARELAQSDTKPARWPDIYWALIGKRRLKSDEDVARAVFSWLCSLPMGHTVFATHDELEQGAEDGVKYAAESLKAKSTQPHPESPEVILNDWTKSRASYLQAFESVLRHCGIKCTTVRGLAKGVDYKVGMKLTDQLPSADKSALATTQLQHAWNVAFIDGRWCLFDCMWAAQRFAANANFRSPYQNDIEHGSEMFYFNTDPAKLIFSHFPFDEQWQLLNPPLQLKDFEQVVLLKPAFFTHGLGICTHNESIISTGNKLILKIAIPPALVAKTLFTFSLKKESRDKKLEEKNLHQFGMEAISYVDSTVTFSFRFPMSGAYKLMLYSRNVGEKIFSDICEYRVEVKDVEGYAKEGDTGEDQRMLEHPFPPTSQTHYGPTEIANEYQLQTIPANLEAQQSSNDGVFEIKFTTTDPKSKLPYITARLRSHLRDVDSLTDCLQVRTVEGPAPPSLTATGLRKSTYTSGDSTIKMSVITAYFPEAGEYALEVYGCPADNDEPSTYFLVWQFLIDSAIAYSTVTPTRNRWATTTLGPKDKTWSQFGLRSVSHPDPLIRIPCEIVKRADNDVDGSGNDQPETLGPKSHDLKIVISKPKGTKLTMIGQLKDITGEEEQDLTDYLLQDEIEEAEAADSTERIVYLVRIAHPQHFYKLYLYASRLESQPTANIPLVYTYIIEAPARIGAGDKPYIGAQYGPFNATEGQSQD